MDGKVLLLLRKEKNLTQEDLSKLLKVNRASIAQWESGKENISLEKLNMYSNIFNVSFDYMLGLSKIRNYSIIKKNLDAKIIGQRLKKIRIKNKLTQEKLASKLNTSHSTISAYESGKTFILAVFAYQICKEYNVSMDWLCGKKD